ncbi:MAG: 16S rRNA (cytosine(1402)-N(4))-methyltransferase RsmH [Trueperaceae bacterium]
MTEAPHLPVMPAEILEALDVVPGTWVVDGTFGAGGHSRLLLEAGANVLAIDQDPGAQRYVQELARERLPGELRFAAGNFRDMEALAAAAGVSAARGVFLDLGVSSMQLDEGERGFAFRHDGPLDMRMGSQAESAADVVNEYGADELAAIIYRYGEERHSRRVARNIVEARQKAPITTTGRLAEVVASAYPGGPRREHPARRTFQALRIHVNDELGALQEGLEAAARLLEPGGRLAVLSYHSLEDRIVKQYLRESPRLTPITKKPLEATETETAINPRARSAKLRVGERSAA